MANDFISGGISGQFGSVLTFYRDMSIPSIPESTDMNIVICLVEQENTEAMRGGIDVTQIKPRSSGFIRLPNVHLSRVPENEL